MKHIFFSILAIFCLATCKSPVSPVKRSLDCYIRILETENQVLAQASLRNEAATPPAPVEMSGGFRFQGMPMKLQPVQGLTYQVSYAGGLVPKYSFEWQEADARHQFEVPMAGVGKFGFDTPTLSRRQATRLRWEGGGLQKGESLVCMWENAALGKTLPMEMITTASIPEIALPAVKISALDPGQWTLYLVRKRLEKATVNGISATAIVEFYSQTDTIMVQE